MAREVLFAVFGIIFLLMAISSGCSAHPNISEVGHSFQYTCTVNALVVKNSQAVCLGILMPNETQNDQDLICLKPGDTKNTSGCYPVLDNCCKKNIKEVYFRELEDGGSYVFVVIPKDGQVLSCGNFTIIIVSSRTGGLLSSQVICTFSSIGTGGTGVLKGIIEDSSPSPATTSHGVKGTIEDSSPSPATTSHGVKGTIEDSSSSPATTSHGGTLLILFTFILMIILVF